LSGSCVILRPAKSGEIAEHFNHYYEINFEKEERNNNNEKNNDFTQHYSYRGLGKNFF
jgi:hypothetical protein